ncbi:MAG: sulfite exporter TauE/SafE family protein [Streptosporangiaceae bacterium]
MLGTGWTEAAAVAAAFLIAVLATPAGVSGAVLLLPFQVSVLGTPSPAVTPTNLLYNVVATPGALYRYWRQGQAGGTLAWLLIAGTLPGVVAGSVIRVELLPSPQVFDLVVAAVLLPLGSWLVLTRPAGAASAAGAASPGGVASAAGAASAAGGEAVAGAPPGAPAGHPLPRPGQPRLRVARRIPRPVLILLAAAVGCVGGIYGIGGGSILAPVLIGTGRPPSEVAPAALASTFVTSVAGVVTFTVLSLHQQGPVAPDWPTGLALGFGGLAGAYTGARIQSRLPDAAIRRLVGILVVAIAGRYLWSGVS